MVSVKKFCPGTGPSHDDVTYATCSILCTASPTAKFYAKNGANVTYVKFLWNTPVRPANCALAHSQHGR
jgi:hypothetical protein